MNRMTWIRIKSGMRIVLPFGLIILLIAGCAPSHKEVMAKQQMERAKKAYAEAKANPNVEAYAPVELQEAGKALQEAEKAEKAQETDDMLHLVPGHHFLVRGGAPRDEEKDQTEGKDDSHSAFYPDPCHPIHIPLPPWRNVISSSA
jgi:hypothetical protein